MNKVKAAVFNGLRSNKIYLPSVIASILCLFSTSTNLFADYSNSPTNYIPAISDVYVCNVDGGSISKLNGLTGGVIKTTTLATGARPFGIAIRPDNATAYVTDNGSGKIYYINCKKDKVLKTITTPTTSNGAIAIHPNGKLAYFTSSAGVSILDTNPASPTFNTCTGKITPTVDFATSIVFTPDGTRAYVSKDGNYGSFSQIAVINTTTHAIIKTIQLTMPTAPLGVAASPDGKRIYAAGWVARNVSVIDSDPLSPTYNTVTSSISVDGEARGIALRPSGDLAYVTLDTGGVDVIVTVPSSNQFHKVIAHIADAGPFGGIHGVAISLDGHFAYVTVADGNNKLYVIDSEPFSETFNSMVDTFTTERSPLGVAVRPH